MRIIAKHITKNRFLVPVHSFVGKLKKNNFSNSKSFLCVYNYKINYSTIVAVIICLITIATMYDGTLSSEEEKNGTSKGRKMLLCFSARRNFATIFEVSYKHRGLDTIHMIRFIMMCCVIFGHRFMQYYYNTTVNMRYYETVSKLIYLFFF